MADIAVTVQKPVKAGITPSYAGSLSTSNTYQVPNTGRTLFHFKKSAAVDCTVTFKTPRTVNGLAVAEDTKTVPASTGDKLYSGFDPATYNVPGTNYLEFTLSDVDGLTFAAFEVE